MARSNLSFAPFVSSVYFVRLILTIMRLSIACAVTAIVLVCYPVPGWPSQKPSDTNPAVKNQAKGKESPTAPPVSSVQQQISADTQDPTREITKQQTQNGVEVFKIPPLDIVKDWLDYAYIGFNFLLVGVAIFQTILLRKTMRATKEAADAANKNATALMSIERPWLDLCYAQRTGISKGGKEVYLGVNWKFKNVGKTPAFLHEILAAVDVVSDGDSTDSVLSRPYRMIDSPIISPGEVCPMITSLLDRELDKSGSGEWKNLVAGSLIMVFSGVIKYSDGFTHPHEFKFSWRLDLREESEGFGFSRLYGGENKNQQT